VLAGAAVLAIATSATPALGGVPPDLAVDDAYSVDEDGTLTREAPGVLENDVIELTSCVAATDTSGLTGELQLAADGSFTYTPPANFNGETAFAYGRMTLGAEGCPGPYDDEATVTITVQPVNDAPTAVADSFQVLAGTTLNVNAPGVLRNDADVDGDALTAVKVNNPTHGVVVLAADGSFSYTPTAGYVGPDVFSYRASDGDLTSPVRTVSLTVTALPTPTPSPTPAPTPTPLPTPSPTPTPEPSPSPSLEPSPSAEPSPSGSPSVEPSAASPSPAPTETPEPVDEEGGVSLPVLLVLVLLAVLVAFGAAFYVPRWVEARRTGGEPPEL
jgi:hypothetical protein